MAQTEHGLGAKPDLGADQGRPGHNVSAGTKGGRLKMLDVAQRIVAVDVSSSGSTPWTRTCRRLDIWKPTLCGYVREKRA